MEKHLLSFAILNDDIDTASILLDYKAVFTEHAQRRGPLHRSACNHSMLMLLSKHCTDIDVNERDTVRGDTALMCAIRNQRIECADKLIEMGADPNITNYDGLTPLMEAIDYGCYPHTIEYCAKLNDPNHVDDFDRVALDHLLTESPSYHILPHLVILLKHGASVHKCSSNIFLAAADRQDNEHFHIYSLLVEYGGDLRDEEFAKKVYTKWYKTIKDVRTLECEDAHEKYFQHMGLVQFLCNNVDTSYMFQYQHM